MGTEKPRAMVSSVSGQYVNNPGQFEAPFITMRELIEMAGGIRDGHTLVWTPGGSSTPNLHRRRADTPSTTSP